MAAGRVAQPGEAAGRTQVSIAIPGRKQRGAVVTRVRSCSIIVVQTRHARRHRWRRCRTVAAGRVAQPGEAAGRTQVSIAIPGRKQRGAVVTRVRSRRNIVVQAL